MIKFISNNGFKKNIILGAILGVITTTSYVVVIESNNPKLVPQVVEQSKDFQIIHGKLKDIQPVIQDGNNSHFLITIIVNNPVIYQEEVIYLKTDYSEKQLKEIVDNNYCVGLVLDNYRYTQVPYRIVKEITLIEKNCE
jgi:hypothetical protein